MPAQDSQRSTDEGAKYCSTENVQRIMESNVHLGNGDDCSPKPPEVFPAPHIGTEDRNQESGKAKMVGGMRRGKAEPSAARDPLNNRRFHYLLMAWTGSFDLFLDKPGTNGI